MLFRSSASQIRAADAEVKVDTNPPKVETRVKTDRDKDLTVRTDRTDLDRTKVRHVNKASGVLGMEVRNRENQKLGEIKDLVFDDVNSGKVSYAVLAVGGFLGIGEKLIALPPSALHVAEDGEYLILDADKARIQAAPGFAATAWPAPRDPAIDRFWSDVKASGAPAGAEKSKIYTDADRDKKKN